MSTAHHNPESFDSSSMDRATRSGGEEAESRDARLQPHRLRMTMLGVMNWVVLALVLALYAWSGTIGWHVVLTFSVVSLSVSLVFVLVIRLNWNLKLKNKELLLPQFVAAVLIQVACLVLVPQLSILFLASFLVFFNFAMLRFDSRMFTVAWLSCSAVIAAALYVARDDFGYPGTGHAQIAILWLFFFLALGRLSEIGGQFSTLRAKLSEANRQLREAVERNHELATHDDLTGSYNRRFFMQMLNEDIARCQRTQQPHCVAIFDLDHFKSVNDTYGHMAGDNVLRTFARLVQDTMRKGDRFARYGGEEFVLLLADAQPADSRAAVERIRHAVERHDWNAIAPGLGLTVSAGIAEMRPGEDADGLLVRADTALYAAKREGRNRFVMAPVGWAATDTA